MSTTVTWPDPVTLLNAVVRDQLAGRRLRMLEAGGGSRSYLDLGPVAVESITTVDIDPAQLERNTYASTRILADLEEVELDGTYDLVVAYDVFEHLRRPDRALERLLPALASGGLLVVGSPVERSFSGMVTKATPHAFHLWVYRHVFGDREAGTPGHGPFRTWFHPLARPDRLATHLVEQGLEPVFASVYESGRYRHIRERKPVLGGLLLAVTSLLNVPFAGTRNVREGDYHLVFRKP